MPVENRADGLNEGEAGGAEEEFCDRLGRGFHAHGKDLEEEATDVGLREEVDGVFVDGLGEGEAFVRGRTPGKRHLLEGELLLIGFLVVLHDDVVWRGGGPTRAGCAGFDRAICGDCRGPGRGGGR